MTLQWDHIDDEAVKTAKLLAADAVEQAGSGHPGAAISLAPAAYLLYNKVMNVDPADPRWIGRDRFILSAGHSSLTQYVQLYLSGFGLELDDVKKLRTAGSLTPGHPEYRHTKGVEITTGPLGTGIASAVGFAMNARRVHGLLDPETPLGESVFDHNVYVIAGDGLARYEAYGWHVQRVDWLGEDGSYEENTAALNEALEAAKAETRKPSLIALRTIIGWPTPGKQNTGGIHGAKLGGEALAGLKVALGADPEKMFDVDASVVDEVRARAAARAAEYRKDWDARFEAWKAANPEGAALLERLSAGRLPEGWEATLPTFEEGKALATRAASGQVLNAIAPVLPELWGGSADLAGSNNTFLKGEPSFLPAHRSSSSFSGDEFGRNLHFGVREFAMGAALNGIAADGLTRAYGGTFFVFSDFMRGAVRLAALMDLPVTYVWTHDSIGVGEDGPTHQPIEHLASYRAIPNLAVVRPADAAETAASWKAILEQSHPAALILSRQNLPNPARGEGTGLATTEDLARGAYVLADTEGTPDVILMASGSEVSVALEAREALAAEGVAARVVSVPCLDWFETQDREYRDAVLPPSVRARISVEAGLALPWYRWIGDAGRAVSIEHFGASAPGELLFKEYGIDAEHVTAAAKESIEAARS